jgi:hypothetical protein
MLGGDCGTADPCWTKVGAGAVVVTMKGADIADSLFAKS